MGKEYSKLDRALCMDGADQLSLLEEALQSIPMRRSTAMHPRRRSTNHSRRHSQTPPQSAATREIPIKSSRSSPPSDENYSALDLAWARLVLDANPFSIMSTSSNNIANLFPPFSDSSNLANNHSAGGPRQAPLPMAQQQPQHPVNSNGNGAGMNGVNGLNMALPMNAGQQMDVNMLYQKVLELSDILKENREKTLGIVAGAEELAARAAANGASPSLQEANAEISAARIADLERQLAHEQNKVRVIIREQKENTKLIGEYETAVGNIVEMVRNYSFNNKAENTSLSLHYNKLLQEERDAHLAARLERDDWHAKFMRSVEMLREAYRLRCEEEETPIRIVSGLQNEVRAYRNALGMEPEKPEDEYGYEILKDVVDTGGDS